MLDIPVKCRAINIAGSKRVRPGPDDGGPAPSSENWYANCLPSGGHLTWWLTVGRELGPDNRVLTTQVPTAGGCARHLSLQSLSYLLIVLALFGGPRVWAQVSPGPISRAHHEMSGPLDCLSCHRLFAGSSIFRCAECHKEIDHRVSRQRGFHASVVGIEETDKACVRCHSEHNGENFPLIRWEPSQRAFDHRKTGYALEGKHADLVCQQCHNAKNIPESERPTIKVKDLNRTFLGLSRDCLSCHEDIHRGQLGKDCLKCHTVSGWKGPSGFNHSKTRFPLVGAHSRLTCTKCHKATEAKAVKYVGLAFDKCSACHIDPHKGAFKGDCNSCHSTTTWKEIQSVEFASRFDHAKTRYPLNGKHADVRCTTCHHGLNFSAPLAHNQCADCHKDPHQGQFRVRKDVGACESCHTVDGFKQARFGVAEHAATNYPLEGKHTTVPCAKCHPKVGQETLYRIKATRCADCHKDVHGEQFARAPYSSQCEGCHTVKGFAPSTFTLARHNTSRFPLVGGHLAVACSECHQARKLPGTAPPAPYRYDDLTCANCHLDPHHDQFEERMGKAGPDGKPLGCEACHTTKMWSDVGRFDHATTTYALIGAHRAVACVNCHKPPNLELTMKNVVFRSAPKQCAGCHEDPHAGQFAADGRSADCAQCHTTGKWRPSLFDHQKGTSFPLEGVHRDVACRSCHKTYRDANGQAVLFYKPTPQQCAACHGPK